MVDLVMIVVLSRYYILDSCNGSPSNGSNRDYLGSYLGIYWIEENGENGRLFLISYLTRVYEKELECLYREV